MIWVIILSALLIAGVLRTVIVSHRRQAELTQMHENLRRSRQRLGPLRHAR